jgi:hypothetical protein
MSSVDVPDETKETLLSILSHAASQDRSVIEFTTDDGTVHAKEITNHVEKLEDIVND